jgi:hypothetical protein
MRAGEPFLLNPDNRALMEGRVSYKHLAKDGHEGSMGFLYLFILVGIIASVFLIGMAVVEWKEWAILRNAGVETQGTIVERYVDTSGDSNSYHVRYTFEHTPANGDPRTYSNEDQVDYAAYQRAEQGRAIAVLYTPADPNLSTLDMNMSPPWMLTGFSAIWIPGFLGAPIFIVSKLSNQKGTMNRLRQGSRKLLGEVLECRQRVDSDNDCFVTLSYRFQSPESGQILEGKHERERDDLRDASKLPASGTPVVVLYRDDKTFQVL